MGTDLEDELVSPGLKRGRQIDDKQTFVQISFNLLSRKSKKKLEELLHQWSEWHAQECSLSEGSDEDLECGEETYFPALNVSMDKSCTISFSMDSQKKKKQRTDDAHFNKDSAPVYDRIYECALVSEDELANKKSIVDFLNASRCFNCDAYAHSLKECPKSFNKDAVNNARKLYQLKSKRPSGPRVLTRYYQDTPGGKFDGLKPGCLDSETRKLLGIGEFDPPPWLNRMREMGYPPGYLDLEDDNQPSGIIIFANEETKEDEECINTSSKDPKRKTSVDFPGINAPIPVNADQNRWANNNFKPMHTYFHTNGATLKDPKEGWGCPLAAYQETTQVSWKQIQPLILDHVWMMISSPPRLVETLGVTRRIIIKINMNSFHDVDVVLKGEKKAI